MSLMAVLITFAAMAVFSGLLIVIATMRSAQISHELEYWSVEISNSWEPVEYIDESAPAVSHTSSVAYH